MAYGFSAEEMRHARPKKVESRKYFFLSQDDSLLLPSHPKQHVEDAQYIPHPCFEREVRAAETIPSVVSNAQQHNSGEYIILILMKEMLMIIYIYIYLPQMQLAAQIRCCDAYNHWKTNASQEEVEKAANGMKGRGYIAPSI